MKLRQALLAGVVAGGLLLGPAAAAQARSGAVTFPKQGPIPGYSSTTRPNTSPVGVARLPFGWGRMSFQITGTGTFVTGFRFTVINDSFSDYFNVRVGVWYQSHWDWTSEWITLAPCWYWTPVWIPGRPPRPRGGFMPPGNYTGIAIVQWGALWGEAQVTWNVHR